MENLTAQDAVKRLRDLCAEMAASIETIDARLREATAVLTESKARKPIRIWYADDPAATLPDHEVFGLLPVKRQTPTTSAVESVDGLLQTRDELRGDALRARNKPNG